MICLKIESEFYFIYINFTSILLYFVEHCKKTRNNNYVYQLKHELSDHPPLSNLHHLG